MSTEHPYRLTKPAAKLTVRGGAWRVDVRAAANAARLVDATYGRPAPEIELGPDSVVLTFPGTWPCLARERCSIALDDGCAWALILRKGAAQATIDARDMVLRSLYIDGGASDLRLVLGPTPSEVRIRGDVRDLTVEARPGIGVRLRATGPAEDVAVHGKTVSIATLPADRPRRWPATDLAPELHAIDIEGCAKRVSLLADWIP